MVVNRSATKVWISNQVIPNNSTEYNYTAKEEENDSSATSSFFFFDDEKATATKAGAEMVEGSAGGKVRPDYVGTVLRASARAV